MIELRAKLKEVYHRTFPKAGNVTRTLARRPGSQGIGHSARRLNLLALGMSSCNSYLEIGVAQGLTLEQVRVAAKVGVDPAPQFDIHKLPKGVMFFSEDSDSFFEKHTNGIEFDLVFLDGLHVWTQTYKDLLNALNHSKPNAVILLDDVIPDDDLSAFPDWDEALRLKDTAGITDGRWQGDVYKALIAVARFHPELDYCVIGRRDRVDNPQALIWRRDIRQSVEFTPAVEEGLLEVGNTSYSSAFPNQEPDGIFSLVPEQLGIDRALAAVSGK